VADHGPDVRSSGTVHRALTYGSGFATDPGDEYVYIVIPQGTSQLIPIPPSLDETGFPHKRDVILGRVVADYLL
jgi:hypothetical protein